MSAVRTKVIGAFGLLLATLGGLAQYSERAPSFEALVSPTYSHAMAVLIRCIKQEGSLSTGDPDLEFYSRKILDIDDFLIVRTLTCRQGARDFFGDSFDSSAVNIVTEPGPSAPPGTSPHSVTSTSAWNIKRVLRKRFLEPRLDAISFWSFALGLILAAYGVFGPKD